MHGLLDLAYRRISPSPPTSAFQITGHFLAHLTPIHLMHFQFWIQKLTREVRLPNIEIYKPISWRSSCSWPILQEWRVDPCHLDPLLKCPSSIYLYTTNIFAKVSHLFSIYLEDPLPRSMQLKFTAISWHFEFILSVCDMPLAALGPLPLCQKIGIIF